MIQAGYFQNLKKWFAVIYGISGVEFTEPPINTYCINFNGRWRGKKNYSTG